MIFFVLMNEWENYILVYVFYENLEYDPLRSELDTITQIWDLNTDAAVSTQPKGRLDSANSLQN